VIKLSNILLLKYWGKRSTNQLLRSFPLHLQARNTAVLVLGLPLRSFQTDTQALQKAVILNTAIIRAYQDGGIFRNNLTRLINNKSK
jgi:hypothetical protein